ncbi:MAG TPA: chemotaxis protein CheW [Gammaproteobacteria bacterium]|nr:chemotaxis protein CheW [Gammaproteobacteria bacterium]
MTTSSAGPFALLQEIDRRCRRNAHGLPRQEEAKQEWSGIGFRLGGLRLVAPLGEVVEILTPPALSKVPGTKPWVRGIANVRGNLLPIMDLQGYLQGSSASFGRRSRVLVVSHKGVFSGLVVDEVLGLRHFLEEERTDELPAHDAGMSSYLKHGFRRGDEHWAVFSMFRLADAPQFLQVAV